MLSVERVSAFNTLESYRTDLEDFDSFLTTQGVDLLAVQVSDVRAYLSDLTDRGFAASSQARRLSALRQFYQFCYAEDIRDDDPTRTVASPRKATLLPGVLSEEEVDRLIGKAEDLSLATYDSDAKQIRLRVSTPCWRCCMRRVCVCPSLCLCRCLRLFGTVA